MDEVTIGAITAVWHRDFDDARRWFELIAASYQALIVSGRPLNWPAYRVVLTEGARFAAFGADAVAGLAAYLERHSDSPMEVIRQLAESDLRDELMSRYALAVEHGAIP